MDGDKETGQQLRINKEIAKEPPLVDGGYPRVYWGHHLLQVVCIALVAPEGPSHSTVIPGNRIIFLAKKIIFIREGVNKIGRDKNAHLGKFKIKNLAL